MVEPMFRTHLAEPKPADLILLAGPEGKHAASVRRMRVGEGIQLGNGKGLRVRGTVHEVAANSLKVRVESVLQESEPQSKLTLVQALAKGDRDELAVQAATELGAWSVIPWQADRSISKWEGPKITKGVDRWQTIVSEATKQSLRAYEPVVQAPVSSKQLLELFNQFDQVLILDPTAKIGLGSVALTGDTAAIVVGPEGGIAEHELEQFEAAGAIRVNMGDPILRTSTAGIAAIALLQAKLGLWG
jgi:16S rRNA (uracil1498-N3)-methyltransferase